MGLKPTSDLAILAKESEPEEKKELIENKTIKEFEKDLNEKSDDELSRPRTSSPRREYPQSPQSSPPSSPRMDLTYSNIDEENEDDELEEDAGQEEGESGIQSSSKLPAKLANIERIIPQSDDSESDKEDSDSSSSSESSDSEWEDRIPSAEKKDEIKSSKHPEEITIDDDEDEAVKNPKTSKKQKANESFLSKTKEKDTDSEADEDPVKKKRKPGRPVKKTKQNNKNAKNATSDHDDIQIFDPLEEERKIKEKKEKQFNSLGLKDIPLSDGDSSADELSEDKSKKTPGKHKKGEIKSTKPQGKKVSMVAAIFRAKKKKQDSDDSTEKDKSLKNKAIRALLPKPRGRPPKPK